MRILVAYDGSAHADAAIDDLLRAGLPHQGEVVVASVAHRGWPEKHVENHEGAVDTPWKATMKEVGTLAETAQSRVQTHLPGWSVSSEPLWGNPAKILLKTIAVWKPDLVVVGSHGRTTAGRLLLGSVSTELVHHAPCSVRVVRSLSKNKGPIRILVGTDGSSEADVCVNAVGRRLWPKGTEARVLAVVETLVPAPTMVPTLESGTFAADPAYRVIEAADEKERVRLSGVADAAADRLQRAGLSASSLVVDGDPRQAILAEAERWRADSVFVGARGLGTLDRLLLGSVSDAMVHHGHCAVEIVRN
jgi:nucleotide-binding universal stress UspA family protein